MHSLLLPLAFGVLAAANPLPVPQDIDWDMVQDTPDPSFSMAVGATAQSVAYDVTSIYQDATDVSSVTVDVTDAATPTGHRLPVAYMIELCDDICLDTMISLKASHSIKGGSEIEERPHRSRAPSVAFSVAHPRGTRRHHMRPCFEWTLRV